MNGDDAPGWVNRVDEHVQGKIDNYLKSLLLGDYPDERQYARRLGRVLHVFLRHDPAIIVGRGAQILLKPIGRYGLRVHLVAPLDWRIHHLMKTENLSEGQALEEIKQHDNNRVFFVRAAYSKQVDDPLIYDITLNREFLTMEAVVNTIIEAARVKGILK